MLANNRLRRTLDWNWDTWYEENIQGEPLSYESLILVRNFSANNIAWRMYERLSEIKHMRGELKEKEFDKLFNELYRELR